MPLSMPCLWAEIPRYQQAAAGRKGNSCPSRLIVEPKRSLHKLPGYTPDRCCRDGSDLRGSLWSIGEQVFFEELEGRRRLHTLKLEAPLKGCILEFDGAPSPGTPAPPAP